MYHFIFALTFAFVLSGCVSAPSTDNSTESKESGDNSKPDSENTDGTVDSNADAGSEPDSDILCEPTLTECPNTACGEFDNGCGEIVDCGPCECENGQPTSTNCGPCEMGSVVCGSNATGEGECVYPELLNSITCDEIYFFDPESSDIGLGSKEKPFGRDLTAVLNTAGNDDYKLVAMMEGDTNMTDQIMAVEGVALIGGFSETFAYQPAVRTKISIDAGFGIEADDISTDTLFANLDLDLNNRTAGNSIAVSIIRSPGIRLQNVTTRAGNGGRGKNGVNGFAGRDGTRGNNGLSGLQALGGAGTCSGWYGRNGGQSIPQICDGSVVSTATAGGGSGGLLVETPGQGYVCDRKGRDGLGVFGGIGGAYLGDGNYRIATKGANGTNLNGDAQSGADGSNQVVVTSTGALVPGNAETGFAGIHGTSGYGGGGGYLAGNVRGGSGGSGGTAGCGGKAGTAGRGGGSSIGLLIFDSIGAQITNSEFIAANGGRGGNGSSGGRGGVGGFGGSGGTASNGNGSQIGGAGGRGGNGEGGGRGGAGAGGHSFGAIDPDNVALDNSNTFTSGAAGMGGVNENGRAGNGRASDHTNTVKIQIQIF